MENKKHFQLKTECFRAGLVKYAFDQWSMMITDKDVLETISGMPILISPDLKQDSNFWIPNC